jgi:putative SOS response-associated peptidase YedK
MMIGLKQGSTRSLMKPANEDALVTWPVSKAVGNVKNNGPELLA